MGKMILAACFITDFGTVLALGGLFANFNIWLLVFVVIMCVVLWFMPAWTKGIIDKLGATRVSEPEVKFIFFILFFWAASPRPQKAKRSCPRISSDWLWQAFFCATKPWSIACAASRSRCSLRSISSKPAFTSRSPPFGPACHHRGPALLLKMLTKNRGVCRWRECTL